ncbi:phospho-N-acetylmuramoyl-pentapeptide-transferase [Bacteroidetes/Chlorobi group bacterium Naka2016]|nr:MAG: phospho-N-acetylmuramoyl-pentapeptide-transferase [Bacteroidetes/Chlorobi group bacterium Naka2016]
MLYYLAMWIDKLFNPPGFGVFQYITFRSAAAAITSLLISFLLGPKIIRYLKRKQVKEQNKLELQNVGNHSQKAGTPTMGGIIVLSSVLIPTLLWGDIKNAYVILIFIATLWMGLVGFLDDYLKVIKKKPKGLIARWKLVGQISLGLLIGGIIYFYPQFFSDNFAKFKTLTTVPFAKDFNFDFSYFYIPIVIFIITATSNAVNLTDGLDGLAIGTVGIAFLALSIITYVTGNFIYSDYLNIVYLKGSGELTIFCAAMVGAALGFLWYNSYPAQIFLGDTGSLALGSALGVLTILIKKELLLPIIGGIFFSETLSVILQVLYFKYTKKKYGEGRRLFLMAPLHHHFEKKNIHESKIVMRFYIIAVMLAIITMTTFKIR